MTHAHLHVDKIQIHLYFHSHITNRDDKHIHTERSTELSGPFSTFQVLLHDIFSKVHEILMYFCVNSFEHEIVFVFFFLCFMFFFCFHFCFCNFYCVYFSLIESGMHTQLPTLTLTHMQKITTPDPQT